MEGSLSIGYSGTDLITKLQSSTDGTNGGKLQLFTKEDGGSLTEKITITENGRLGIGTTNPQKTLHAVGTFRLNHGTDPTVNNNIFLSK